MMKQKTAYKEIQTTAPVTVIVIVALGATSIRKKLVSTVHLYIVFVERNVVGKLRRVTLSHH